MLGLGISIALGAAPKAFTPDDISDLEMWCQYDTGLTIEEGGTVSAWTDQTGNEHNLIQAVSDEQPSYASGNIRFNGTDNAGGHDMNIDTDISINANADFTLVTRISLGTTPANDAIWGNNSNNLLRMNNAGAFRAKLGGSGSSDFSEASATLTTGTFYTVFLVRSDGTTGNLHVYVGGDSYTDNGGKNWDSAESHTDTDAFVINTIMALSNESQRFRGDIKEMLVYNKALSADERQQIIDYHTPMG